MDLTRCLPVLLLVAMAATTGASEDGAGVTMCYPPPTLAADGGSEFRGNLLCLLEDLPSAAAPTGFACLESAGRTASDRALVYGLCSNDTAPEPCRRCLADAGKKMAEQCGDASRRATFWDERCSVFYSDGANSSASADDKFGAVYFSGDAVPSPDTVSVQRVVALAHSLAELAPKNYDSVATADATIPASKGDATTRNRTVEVRAKCKRDSSAPDCALCLREASLAIARSWEAGGGAQGREAMVHGSDCYLLFEISTPPTLRDDQDRGRCRAEGRGPRRADRRAHQRTHRRADGCLRSDEDEGQDQQECSSARLQLWKAGSHIRNKDDEISIGVQD